MPEPTFGPDKCQEDKCLNPQVQAFVHRGICPLQAFVLRGICPTGGQMPVQAFVLPGICLSRHLSANQIMTLQNNVYINRHLMKNLTSSYRCLPSTEGGPFTLGVTKSSSQQSQNFSISWSIPIKEYNVITLFTICTVLNELVQENSLWTVSKY